jgi:hypothetical protein
VSGGLASLHIAQELPSASPAGSEVSWSTGMAHGSAAAWIELKLLPCRHQALDWPEEGALRRVVEPPPALLAFPV